MLKKITTPLFLLMISGVTFLSAACHEDRTCFSELEEALLPVRSGILNPYTGLEDFIENSKAAISLIPEETKNQLEMLK
ncbi:MAG: hypothetical protein AAGG81_06580, partial [Chlamydiota bacterium]